MANLYRKPVLLTDPKTGEKIKTKSSKWWGQYKDASGRLRRHPLSVDKRAAQAMLHEIVRKVELEKAGLVDRTDDERKRPLSQHLDEYKSYLRNKGVTEKQLRECTRQLDKMRTACKWTLFQDITVASALGYLGDLRTKGRSAQTYNHYLKVAQVIHAMDGTGPAYARGSRGPCIASECGGRSATRPAGFVHGGVYAIVGRGPRRQEDRGDLGAGPSHDVRVGHLDRIPQRGDWQSHATVTQPAGRSADRHRAGRVQQTSAARYAGAAPGTGSAAAGLAGNETGTRSGGLVVFHLGRAGGIERKTHKMMQHDLESARIAWLKEAQSPQEQEAREKSDFLAYANHAGRFADFHSCRHLFITSLERAGIRPKVAQTLARHSDIRLTLNVYTHAELADQTAAIGVLPGPPAAKSY